ncbi:hypothetical protein D3C74_376700 [compost metagenome]
MGYRVIDDLSPHSDCGFGFFSAHRRSIGHVPGSVTQLPLNKRRMRQLCINPDIHANDVSRSLTRQHIHRRTSSQKVVYHLRSHFGRKCADPFLTDAVIRRHDDH